MIVVIADDITGAAELAGIGLRYNLKIAIVSDLGIYPDADLVVVYTNTRSLEKNEAVSVMSELTEKALSQKPQLIYKKTDSVLRGHVLAEMKAQMEALKANRGLLIPVNPLLGRTIKNGRYFIQNTPVDQAGFSNDPEFPIKSSFVRDMLGDEGVPVSIIKEKTSHLPSGISVGDAETMGDVLNWTKFMDSDVLLAGGASFFDALLKSLGFNQSDESKEVNYSLPILLVSGTTYNLNVSRIKNYNRYVSYMPENIFQSQQIEKAELLNWAHHVLSILSTSGKAIIAVGNHGHDATNPKMLADKISEVVNIILNEHQVTELLVEGGSTAYSIIKRSELSTFYPTHELSQGVVRMAVKDLPNLFLTIKPGSYQWPAEWNFN